MASGRPDWYSNVALSGQYDSTLIPVLVDSDGHLISLMKGQYDTTLKTIATDDNGIMKANLAAQDLLQVTVVPIFGIATRITGNMTIDTDDEVSLFSVEGKGTIYSGYVYWICTNTSWNNAVNLYIDDDLFASVLPSTCITRGLYNSESSVLYLLYSDNYYKREHAIGVRSGITFDEKFEVKYDRYVGGIDHDVFWTWAYALV